MKQSGSRTLALLDALGETAAVVREQGPRVLLHDLEAGLEQGNLTARVVGAEYGASLIKRQVG